MKHDGSAKGNALFLILIAVALFAALSYAITQSGRGSGNIDRENLQIAVAQSVQKIGMFRQNILRMSLGGTPANTIRLTTDANENNTSSAPSYPQTYCSTGAACIFAPDGGRLDAGTLDLPEAMFASITGTNVTGHRQLFIVSGNIIGNFGYGDSSVADRLIFITNIKRDACIAFNKGLGVPHNADLTSVTTAGQDTWCFYDGTIYNIQVVIYG